MIPRQSTENRELHIIRTIHHQSPTRQASKQTDREEPMRWGRAMRIGKKGKRQSLDIGSNEPHSSPSFLIISSEHTTHETTPSRPPPSPHHRSSAEPTQAARYHSFRLPPRPPPCRRAGRDDTASKQHQHRHLITHSLRHRPHLIRSRRTDRQGSKQSHGQPGQARDAAHQHRRHQPSKQDEILDPTPRLPAPRSEQTRSENGTRWMTSPAP